MASTTEKAKARKNDPATSWEAAESVNVSRDKRAVYCQRCGTLAPAPMKEFAVKRIAWKSTSFVRRNR